MSDAFNLLDETFTTIAVRFYNYDEEDFKPRGKTYNYKVPRSWGVKVGDLLVVPATSTLRIVKIAEVHDEPQFNGLPNLSYAVQRIDMTEHEQLQARRQVERQREKDALLESLKTSAAGSPAARVLLGEALALVGVEQPAPPPAPGHTTTVKEPL